MKSTSYIVLFLIILASASCAMFKPSLSPRGPVDPTGELPLVETPEFVGVIIPAQRARTLSLWTRRQFSDFWTPSTVDIILAEKFIRMYMSDKMPDNYARINEYKRQYFGIIVNGQKRIYCHFIFPDEHLAKWRKEPVYIADATGKEFFPIEYDITSHQCVVHQPGQDDAPTAEEFDEVPTGEEFDF